MDSFTISFTGRTSILESVFNPPIDLDGEYQIALVDFQSYNSIYNVKEPDNVLYYYKPKKYVMPRGVTTLQAISDATQGNVSFTLDKNKNVRINTKVKLIHHMGLAIRLTTLKSDTVDIKDGEDLYYYDQSEIKSIIVPQGSYEINDLVREIQTKDPSFQLIANNKTMRCTLISDNVYDFRKGGIGAKILGFTGLSTANFAFEGTNITQINNVNVLRIGCNIAEGSYINGKPTHSIHSFFPEAPPGYKLIELPKNLLYFPINVRTLDKVVLTIVDQNGNIVDFNGEEITVRCHIRKIS